MENVKHIKSERGSIINSPPQASGTISIQPFFTIRLRLLFLVCFAFQRFSRGGTDLFFPLKVFIQFRLQE